MALTPADLAFLESHQSAAMITVGESGFAKVARVGIAVVDGELDEAEFVARMAGECRLIYDFDVQRSYGLTGMPTS